MRPSGGLPAQLAHLQIKIYLFNALGQKTTIPASASTNQDLSFHAPRQKTTVPASASTNQELSFQCARPENYGSRQRIN
jgi:hypothetical protein